MARRVPKEQVPPPLQRGDLVMIEWVDILQDPAADPETADLATWHTPGFWYGAETRKGVDCIIAMGSVIIGDKNLQDQTGWICIPRVCVKSVKRLKEA